MAWAEYIIAAVAFFVGHSLPIRPPIRPWLVLQIGRSGFTVAYSIFSLLLLAWWISAAGRAPYVEIWSWAAWQSYLTVTIMALVCLIVATSLGRPNPFSFGGSDDRAFDPLHPGIIRLMRHPMLVALAGWALAHMIANGNLAHLMMFGAFLLFAIFGQLLIDHRRQKELGAEWFTQLEQMKGIAIISIPHRKFAILIRLLAGLLAFAALLWLHPWAIGVDPLP